jgi:ArsR family transcriptional regulator
MVMRLDAKAGAITVAEKRLTRERELYDIQANLCRSLAHPTRLAIIHYLIEEKMGVTRLAKIIGVSQANLSQHLAILRDLGVLRRSRHGTSVLYSVTDSRIVEACNLIRTMLEDRIAKQNRLFR